MVPRITEESKNQRTLQKTVTKSEKEIARERENLGSEVFNLFLFYCLVEHQITATIAGYKELRKVEKTHHDALMARELQLNEKGFQDKLRQQVQVLILNPLLFSDIGRSGRYATASRNRCQSISVHRKRYS